MTSFVHTEFPSEHPGVMRAERVAKAFNGVSSRFDGARGGASLLLAGVVALVLVVANHVVETWTDGNLLAAWIVLWAIAFGALALLAAPALRAARSLRSGTAAWSERRRQEAADEQLWNVALHDARVMADISRAMSADANRDVRGYY